MPKGKTLQLVFKQDFTGQMMLLPPSLEELVAADHPVRTVAAVLDEVDMRPLLRRYKMGGTSSYHPRMLLKAVVFAYMNNIYSSRRIEQALKENIHYMWLCGMSQPDHNTIARFRGQRLQKTLEPIFTQVVLLLCNAGVLSVKDVYTDGTKIEANANRYTFVWGNSIKTNKEKIHQQIKALWDYAKSVAKAELDDDTDPSGYQKIDADKVKQTIRSINEAIEAAEAEVPKQIKQKLSYAETHWPSALDKYEVQQQVMGSGRNSYSKTDTDSTFMRMKEDHMKNGQLKPAYNLQISSNNQYIVNYSLHQKTTDTSTLIAHTNKYIDQYNQAPDSITADAGYGSEENYQYLQQQGIDAYVKHNQFDRKQHKTTQAKHPFTADKLYYNEAGDYYICPMGQHMLSIGTYTKITATGYKQQVKKYKALNCEGCPLRGVCHQSKGNRVIEINANLNHLKQQADEKLKSEEGIKKRKQRCHDVEPVFANIKNNHGFKRYLLRGLPKVTVETGLLALAHNLRKKTTPTKQKAA
jgi:transposase